MTQAPERGALNPEIRSLALYSLFGLIGLGSDFLIFTALRSLELHIGLSNSVSYLAGTLISFALNYRVNFRAQSKPWVRMGSFVVIAALGATGSSVTLALLAPVVELPELVVKAMVTVPFLAGQYLGNRLVTFGRIGN